MVTIYLSHKIQLTFSFPFTGVLPKDSCQLSARNHAHIGTSQSQPSMTANQIRGHILNHVDIKD
jgi:hypothetical protein